MEKLFNNEVLQELYDNRNEEISHYCIRNDKEYDQHRKKLEKELFKILRYVPEEKKFKMENEIEDFIYEHISLMSEYWCAKYYKVGFADGLSVKKDVERELEELSNGKSDE